MALVVKNPPANVGDIRDSGSIPGLGRSPGGLKLSPEVLVFERNKEKKGLRQGGLSALVLACALPSLNAFLVRVS